MTTQMEPPQKLKDEEAFEFIDDVVDEDDDAEKYASAIVPQTDDPTAPTFT